VLNYDDSRQLSLWPDAATARAAAPGFTIPTNAAVAAFLAARSIRPTTRAHYEQTFQHLRAFSSQLPTSPLELERFLASRPVSPHTRDGYYRDLRCFYRWSARRLGIADAAADLTRPRRPPALPRVLTNAQVVALLSGCNRRERAVIAFALDTGARLGEIAGVRRSDISAQLGTDGATHHQVRLPAAKAAARVVPLTRPAAALLTGIGDADHLWLSAYNNSAPGGDPMTPRALQLLIRRATKRTLGREYGPHALRHTFATMYLRAGGDVESLRRILGHSNVSTTLVYLHLVADDLSRKHDLYSPIAQHERTA